MPASAYRRLYAVAEDQMGYVTTAGAAAAGVEPATTASLARRGHLDRVSRGVYRLVDFPMHPLSQYMQATLWPYDHPGILSHATALALYEMSDASPPKVHITVPIGYRIQRAVPSYLVVHHAELRPSEVTAFERMPITTPDRTVSDCIAANLGPSLIRQAIDDGRRSGRLSVKAANTLAHELATTIPNGSAARAKRARTG